MMKPFVSFSRIVQNIVGWGRSSRVCVIAGAQDKIVSVPIAKTMADCIQDAFEQSATRKKLDGLSDQKGSKSAVDFIVVRNGPHHFQNDLMREEAAGQVLAFLQDLD